MSDIAAPNLSILIPTFNRQAFLSQCLDSLLIQNCVGYELLIRDNDSEDDTKVVCEDYSVKFATKNVTLRYVKNPTNVGFRDNMVNGLHDLNNKYAMILMDDDFLIDTQALSSLYQSIDSNPSVKLCSSPVYQHKATAESSVSKLIDNAVCNEQKCYPNRIVDGDEYFLNAWTKYQPLVLSSAVFDRLALLDSEWEKWSERAALDVNMYNILALKGEVSLFDNKFVAYRIHDTQDFGNIPLEDCYASHQCILNWYHLASKTGRFSRLTLFAWRVKTVILKDQGIVKRLYARKNDDAQVYFSWLKKYNLWHYYIMSLLMPECIRNTKQKKRNDNIIKAQMVAFRRQVLRVFLHLFRREYDPDYQLPWQKARKGET